MVGAFAAFHPFDEIEDEGFDSIAHSWVGGLPSDNILVQTNADRYVSAPLLRCLGADLSVGRRVLLALPAAHGSPPGIYTRAVRTPHYEGWILPQGRPYASVRVRIHHPSRRDRGRGAGPGARQNTTRRGYYGALVLKYTTVTEQGAAMLGGHGGWNVTPSLVLGGGLDGTLSQVDAQSGVVSAAGDPLDIKFESFGLDLDGETDFMFVVEPTVGADWALAEWAHMHVAVSYRVVDGVEQRGLTGSDFNGTTAVVAVKFGRFRSIVARAAW